MRREPFIPSPVCIVCQRAKNIDTNICDHCVPVKPNIATEADLEEWTKANPFVCFGNENEKREAFKKFLKQSEKSPQLGDEKFLESHINGCEFLLIDEPKEAKNDRERKRHQGQNRNRPD